MAKYLVESQVSGAGMMLSLEEQHLADKFDQEYLECKSRVRRWI